MDVALLSDVVVPFTTPALPSHLSTVEIDGEQWVVGSDDAVSSAELAGYGAGPSGRVRAVVLRAATLRAENASTLRFVLTGDVFSTALLAADAPGLARRAMGLATALASPRAFHEPGWARGWRQL